VQTAEKYLGCKQRLREAANDRIGIEPDDRSRLKIILSKKTCSAFNLGNLLRLETVKVSLP
jgi:hypothetical protein